MSTCMFYTGLDPRNMTEVYVPRNAKEKAKQRALLQYKNPANYFLVREALIEAGREDLIGSKSKCLIPMNPPPSARKKGANHANNTAKKRRNEKVKRNGK